MISHRTYDATDAEATDIDNRRYIHVKNSLTVQNFNTNNLRLLNIILQSYRNRIK